MKIVGAGRVVGNPETDRLPVAGSISELPVSRHESGRAVV